MVAIVLERKVARERGAQLGSSFVLANLIEFQPESRVGRRILGAPFELLPPPLKTVLRLMMMMMPLLRSKSRR